MKLTDLTEAYRTGYLEQNDSAVYYSSYPDLFAHYRTFWGRPGGEPVALDIPTLEKQRQLILDCLPELESQFLCAGLDVSEVELVLMVGHNTSNGHGLILDDRCIAWLAVETYTSTLLARVFVTHEFIHGLHYSENPEFDFADPEQRDDPMRQLLTEGIATYLTCEILAMDAETALWADYMEAERVRDWMNRCEEDISELARHILQDMSGDKPTSMFVASDPDDICMYRGGYYLGLRVIETLVKNTNCPPLQLLRYPRASLEVEAERLLRHPASLIATP